MHEFGVADVRAAGRLASTAHGALATGTNLTAVAGYTVDDPYAAVPGSYISSDAETYRYYMRPDAGGVHHSLFREINLNAPGSEVAQAMNDSHSSRKASSCPSCGVQDPVV